MKICKREGCTNEVTGRRFKYCSQECQDIVNAKAHLYRQKTVKSIILNRRKNALKRIRIQKEKGLCVTCNKKALVLVIVKKYNHCQEHRDRINKRYSKKIVLVDQKSYNEVSQV